MSSEIPIGLLPTSSKSWRQDSKLRRWFLDPARLTKRVGYWIETFSIARADFETIFGTNNPAGVACKATRNGAQ